MDFPSIELKRKRIKFFEGTEYKNQSSIFCNGILFISNQIEMINRNNTKVSAEAFNHFHKTDNSLKKNDRNGYITMI